MYFCSPYSPHFCPFFYNVFQKADPTQDVTNPISFLIFFLITCKIFLCSLTLCNSYSFFTQSLQLISTLLQQHISKLSRYFRLQIIIIIIIIIIIGIQPLGRSGQRPELSQATGMALVRCILGKFLGVACHCFPPIINYKAQITRHK